MKTKWLRLALAAAFVTSVAACGGGDSGGGGGDSAWNTGSETNPAMSNVDAAGNAVTSISPNAPVIGKAQGLLQNGVYNVAILKPDGTALNNENLKLISDGNGNLSDSIMAYLGAGETNPAAMTLGKDAAGLPVMKMNYKAVTPGDYKVYICRSDKSTCDASTASATTTITVDDTKPYVFSADSTGAGVNSFLNGTDDVYAVVTNGPPNTLIGLRIVSNSFQIFSNGNPIPADASGVTETCNTDAAGACPPTLIWTKASATLDNQAALFDIVADVGNDGNWNEGTDFMDASGYVPGFAIQNATPATSADIAAITIDGTNLVNDIACAADGSAYCTHVDIFNNTDVYGYLNPTVRSSVPHNLAYKFIILHSDALKNGDALTPIQNFGYDHTVDPLQWGCTNEGRILLWPKGTQIPGCYDVVMDVNKNLVYDAGIDVVDGYSGVCGFVIPGVEGAPAMTLDAITDGAGGSVPLNGSTGETTATFTFTVTPASGKTLKQCTIQWASGKSSSEALLDITAIPSGGQMTTQKINLFTGVNSVSIVCLDQDNKAGAAATTIESSNTSLQNIHFQASLNWEKSSNTYYDMDLHVVMPGGAYFGNTDCYFGNCKEASGGNPTVGAILNVDCIDQCTGPENIWIPSSNALTAGIYKVCVDPYSGEGKNLSIAVYDQNGALVDTVSHALLSDSLSGTLAGDWYVGNFTCAAGTSGTCTWSRVDTVSLSAPCQ